MATPTNAVIGFPRYTEDFTFADATGSPQLFDADYPATNLGSLPLARVGRCNSTTMIFTATCSTPRLIQCFGFCRHNFSLTATYRIQLYSDAAMTTEVYDSADDAALDTDVWPIVYPQGERPYISSNFWTGRYAAAEIAGYVWTRPVILSQAYIARGIKVTISDPDNTDGHLECGLFEIAQAWELGVNFEVGAQYGFRSRTKVIEADGGVLYRERKDKPRKFQGSIQYLDRDEALARAWEHQRQLDIDTPFLWVPHPQEPIHWLRTAGLFHNVELGLLSYAVAADDTTDPDSTDDSLDTVPFSFEEEL